MATLFACFALGYLALFSRLVYLEFLHPKNLGATAKAQSKFISELPPFRGKILDRNHAELAIDLRLYSLGVNSRQVKNPEELAEKLHEALGLDRAYLLERLKRDKSFVWIARQLSQEQTAKIRDLHQEALELRPEWKRIYPNRHEAAQIIGFTGIDHFGLEGVEFYFDHYLKGIPGWKSSIKDAKQREVVSRQTDLVPPVDGYDMVLSIDTVIQHMADQYLAEACEKHNALGGSIVVMEPQTGDILAMANWPTFDLNEPGPSDPAVRKNRAITDIYEPGSVFKAFTLAAALESGAVKLRDKIFCEYGKHQTGGRVLHDVHAYGNLSVTDVIIKSSNIGTAKMAEALGKDRLYAKLKEFGVAEKTGVDLAGEVSGMLRAPKAWSATSISSISIGQEVGMTAVQLTAALNAITNGGVLVKPRIVHEIRGEGSRSVKVYPPVQRRRVISQKTAAEVKQVMVGVVESGTGKKAAIKGARVGGKTGTAQKLEPNGAYSHDHFISSFGGFVEKNGKAVTILVSIDDPHPLYYGGTVAAPVFAKIGEGILEYWQ